MSSTTPPPRILRLNGCKWGFQFANFYGEWERDFRSEGSSRPVYSHQTTKDRAFLYHIIDPNYNVPRWVIGPKCGDAVGWAFAESDAKTPNKIVSSWISWDGSEWISSGEFRMIAPGESGYDDFDAAMEQTYMDRFESTDDEEMKGQEQPDPAHGT